jgi:large subunit ribosomal protein L25
MLSIECLPSDLFESITVDVANLKIGDVVRVKDLQMPADVTVREADEEDVLRIQRFVEAKVEEGAGAESAEVEVIEKGKKDEEAAA